MERIFREFDFDIEIEDYLDEVSTRCLEIELDNRGKKISDSKHINRIFKVTNTREELVIESLVEKFLKIPIQELENFLDKY